MQVNRDKNPSRPLAGRAVRALITSKETYEE